MSARQVNLNKHTVPPRGRARAFRMAACAAALSMMAAAVLAQDAKPPKAKLTEEVEKAFAAFVDRAKETRKGITKTDLAKLCDDVAKAVKLTPEQRAKLEAEAAPAIDEACDKFGSKLDEWLRPFVAGYGERALANLERWDAPLFASKPNVAASPQDTKAWTAALERVLTPDQRTAYQDEWGDKTARRKREIATYLKDPLATRRNQLLEAFKGEREGILREIALDKERIAKLEAAEKTAVAAILAEDESTAVKQLLEYPEDTWRQMFTSGGTHPFENSGSKVPLTKREGWTKALATVLNPEELKRWEEMLARRQERRDRAAKMGAVTELEERVLLSAEQRTKLEKIFLEVWRRYTPNENNQIFPLNLLRGGTSDSEVRAVLNTGQQKRWEEFLRGGSRAIEGLVRQDKKPAGNAPQPVDTERVFAAHLVKLYHNQRDRMISAMQERVDELVRVTGLSGPSLKLVEVAAKGAVERVLDSGWKSRMDVNVRNSVQGVGPQFLQQRLDAMGESRYSYEPPEKHPLWTQALQIALTDVQRKAYDGVLAERRAYRERAIVYLILAQLDSTLRLSGEQGDKLEPLLAEAVKEYWPDYERNFSGSNYAIYPTYLPVLLAGVPEEARKAILSPEQMKQFDSDAHGRYSGWWDSMKRSHDQRKKAAK